MNVETLIENQILRANFFATAATAAVEKVDIDFPVRDFTQVGVDPADFNADYVQPEKDNTPNPVYETPSEALPNKPVLIEVSGISQPIIPVAPQIKNDSELKLDGLFEQQFPDTNLPESNFETIQLLADEIYADLKTNIPPAAIDDVMPGITSAGSLIGGQQIILPDTFTMPVIVTPIVDESLFPTMDSSVEIGSVTNYADYQKAEQTFANSSIKTYVNNVVSDWVGSFAGRISEAQSNFDAKILDATSSNPTGVFPVEFESALNSRARARVEAEYSSAENAIIANSERRGYLIPPGAVTSSISKARLEAARSIAGQSAEIYIEKARLEAQYMQFMVGLVQSHIQGIRDHTIQVAQIGLSLTQQAQSRAESLASKLMTMFEHEKMRRELSMSILKSIGETYDLKLKIAMAELVNIQAAIDIIEKLKPLEMMAYEAEKVKLDMLQTNIQRYSAIVDSVSKRVSSEELKIKGASLQAELFNTSLQAYLASFEAYKAGIDGDKAKVDGAMARIELYDSQIKTLELGVDVQSKAMESNLQANSQKISQYGSEVDAYKIATSTALDKFTAQAEIKKLGLDIYKNNVAANLEVYKGQLQEDIAFTQAKLEAFKGNIDSISNFYQLEKSYAELNLRKAETIASGLSNMGSATLQALGTTVSQVLQE